MTWRKMHPVWKQTWVGALSALGVAYAYVVLLMVCAGERPSTEAYVLLPLWAVLHTSWFVIPVGAVLGLAIPRWFGGCSPAVAALAGAGVGALAGLLIAVLTVVWEQWP